MLKSSTERVPSWRLQQTVNILRASREMPVIRFPGGMKKTSLGEEFVVEPAAALHLNTKSAFAWWYATRYVRSPSSWRAAARKYSKENGLAIVVCERNSISLVLNCYGLSLWRDGGEVVSPQLMLR